MFFDFKHEESSLDGRIFTLDKCLRTYSLTLNFMNMSEGGRSKQFKNNQDPGISYKIFKEDILDVDPLTSRGYTQAPKERRLGRARASSALRNA